MKPKVELEYAQRTHPGMVRSHNEDSISVSPTVGLAVLADGMGGYNAGEIASGMATALLRSSLEADLERGHEELISHGRSELHALLQARISEANGAIFQSSQNRAEYSGMGTTLVMALFKDNIVTSAHIGDSRMYRLRGQEFMQVTRDHSLLQDQLDAGLLTREQAALSQNKNLVTRALGVDSEVLADIADHATEEGDIYLLCSDGLSDMVSDADIGRTLRDLALNLELAADTLISMANDHGGRDNVSVILVRVQSCEVKSPNFFVRFIKWLK